MKIAAISVADLFESMDGWPIEEKGLFPLLILKMYARGRGLPDDDGECARMFGYRDVRTFKAAKAKLIARGAIFVEDGLIKNARCMDEIAAANVRREKSVEDGKKGGRPKKIDSRSSGDLDAKSNRSSPDLDSISDRSQVQQPKETGTYENPSPSPSPSPNEEKRKVIPAGAGFSLSECLAAFQAWNETALRCALPQAAKLTPDRQRKIAARLRDYGLDGWRQALAHIEQSAFLTGQNDRGFRANLEFVCQPSSFAKLIDGAYGNGRHADAKPPAKSNFAKFAHLYEGSTT